LNRDRSAAEISTEKEWIDLARDYLHDRITKAEFEKRKLRLELRGLKIEKVSSPKVPSVVNTAVKTFNGSAVQVQEESQRGCPVEKNG
jgi:hypothetical protein